MKKNKPISVEQRRHYNIYKSLCEIEMVEPLEIRENWLDHYFYLKLVVGSEIWDGLQ